MALKYAVVIWALAGSLGWASAAVAQPPAGQARSRAEREVEREQARFRAMDTNNDGVITRREWRGNTRAFNRHDTNRDGVLSGSEVWVPARRGEAGTNAPADTAEDLAKQTPAYRAGYDRGLVEGRQAGKEDKTLRNQWDLEGQRELEQADSGYTPQVGPREDYQAGYRAGFRLGYRQGFGPR